MILASQKISETSLLCVSINYFQFLLLLELLTKKLKTCLHVWYTLVLFMNVLLELRAASLCENKNKLQN